MSTDYKLDFGTHATPADGRCAMEWVSYLAGEPHSDEPACVSPVLRGFCIALNDGLEDRPRQRLRPYLTRTIGTVEDGEDEGRAWLAMDWLIRTYAPTWLEAAGLSGRAEWLRAQPRVSAADGLPAALDALALARREARTAWSDSPTAWLSPTGIAARATTREMAWAAAAAAAWAAARTGVGDIAGDRARAAARATAGDAAAIIARAGRARSSRAAARQAARAALAPTLELLQDSVFELLDRMLPTVELELPWFDPTLAGARELSLR
jgi:hypothetical protein